MNGPLQYLTLVVQAVLQEKWVIVENYVGKYVGIDVPSIY